LGVLIRCLSLRWLLLCLCVVGTARACYDLRLDLADGFEDSGPGALPTA
jgi:hypothetical protein